MMSQEHRAGLDQLAHFFARHTGEIVPVVRIADDDAGVVVEQDDAFRYGLDRVLQLLACPLCIFPCGAQFRFGELALRYFTNCAHHAQGAALPRCGCIIRGRPPK